MNFDFEKEEKKYLDALDSGRYFVETSSNKGIDQQLNEQRDLEAFKEDLQSEDFKSFTAEAFGK